jgi:hypothetical protein
MERRTRLFLATLQFVERGLVMASEESLCADALSALQQLETPALRDKWTRLFKQPPPKYLSRDLLIRSVAYKLQEQSNGSPRAMTVRRLRRLAQTFRTGSGNKVLSTPMLQPGVRLMREWNGKTQVVEVLQDGFAWRGTKYASLSAVARAITGVRWSGVRFFGLRVSPTSSDSDTD